jgi:hypothetical protein
LKSFSIWEPNYEARRGIPPGTLMGFRDELSKRNVQMSFTWGRAGNW